MSSGPALGAALGGWQPFRTIRAQCPGCEAVGREVHDLCRQQLRENGTLIDCWRLANVPLPEQWRDFENTGGQGCRRFFIPVGTTTASQQTEAVAARTPASPPRKQLSLSVLTKWCDFIRDFGRQFMAHRSSVAGFYAERRVPLDPRLYSIGPSRHEAQGLVSIGLSRFLSEQGLESSEGLPGTTRSSYGSGAFFPAAKYGEAWEWIFNADGTRRGWSRRFICPEREGRDHPKSKIPIGGTHALHHVPGWCEAAIRAGALLVTEGVRKANEAQRRTGIGALGAPSVALSRFVQAAIRSALDFTRPRVLYLAPDFADLGDGDPRHDPTRMQVMGWGDLLDSASELGICVRALAWDPGLGKGIDDALAQLGWLADGGQT